MKDYLAYAADCMANAHLDFEAVCYPTAAAALEALGKGEVDCVFPANFSPYNGEQIGVVMTPPLAETEVFAVIRHTDQRNFARREHAFLVEHFPDWRCLYYPTTADCLKAVADGVADCVLISNYRYNNVARLCEKYRLTTISTNVEMDYSFAVEKGETLLYSILTKTVGMVPKSTVNTAMSYYISEEAKLSLRDFLQDHLVTVLSVAAAVVLIILLLLIQNMRSVRKAQRLNTPTACSASIPKCRWMPSSSTSSSSTRSTSSTEGISATRSCACSERKSWQLPGRTAASAGASGQTVSISTAGAWKTTAASISACSRS